MAFAASVAVALAWLAHAYAVCVLALLVVALPLALEARRDPEVVARFCCLLAAGYAGIGVVALLSDDTGRVRSGSFAGVMLLSAVVAAAAWYRLKSRPDEVPNVLLEFFGPDGVLEEADVQWVGIQASTELNDDCSLDIYFQNCSDRERALQISFEDSAGLLRTGGHIDHPGPTVGALGPKEVKKLRVSVRPGKTPTTQVELFLTVKISGSGGRRARKFRGKIVRGRTSRVAQLGALAGGMFVWGGGVAFRFRMGNAAAPGARAPLPTPAWETVWPRSRSSIVARSALA